MIPALPGARGSRAGFRRLDKARGQRGAVQRRSDEQVAESMELSFALSFAVAFVGFWSEAACGRTHGEHPERTGIYKLGASDCPRLVPLHLSP